MGWLSDKLFGKRKKLDIDKMNANYKAYTDFMGEQEGIAKQMMDPRSLLNLSRQNMLRNQQYDFAAMQGNQISKMGAMTGMSPGQTLANVSANYASTRGNIGKQFQDMLFDQYDRGLGLMQNVGQMKKGEGDRLSRTYMAQINAANARRNARMQNMFNLAGLGIKAGSEEGIFS